MLRYLEEEMHQTATNRSMYFRRRKQPEGMPRPSCYHYRCALKCACHQYSFYDDMHELLTNLLDNRGLQNIAPCISGHCALHHRTGLRVACVCWKSLSCAVGNQFASSCLVCVPVY